ncbi:MAG: hypothetical protein ACK51G_12335 [Pseudomonadota bacterium]
MTRAPVSLAAAGGVACASTIFGLFALPGPAAPERAFVVLLTGLAWLGVALALAVAAGQVRGIVDEQRVLGARVSPRPHWAAQRRASLGVIAWAAVALVVTLGWQALVAAADVAPGMPAGPWPGALAAALTAAGVLHALMWLGVLAWWGRAHPAWLAGACAALSGLLAVGWDAALGALAQAPWLALPALAAAVGATHRAQRLLWPGTAAAAMGAAATAARAPSPRMRATGVMGRLRGGFARVDPAALPLGGIVAGQLPSTFMHHPPRDGLFLVSWGSPFDLLSVMRLALLAAGMCLCLRTGALHWRLLLAPGGRSRRGLVADLVLRSWLGAVAGLLLMCGIAIPIGLAVADGPVPGAPTPPAWLAEVALRFGPTLLCEMLLATALAVLVRPFVRSALAACAILLAASFAAAACAGVLSVLAGIDPLPGWPREGAHHLGVIALAVVVTWLARLGWNRADLRQVLGPRAATSTWSASWRARLELRSAGAATRRRP